MTGMKISRDCSYSSRAIADNVIQGYIARGVLLREEDRVDDIMRERVNEQKLG